MIAVQNLKGEIISTYTFTKRGGMYFVSAIPSWTAYWIFMKLYTFVVHYLQMCMKEYGCCQKFERGDNSSYTFTKRGGGMYLVSATPTKLLIKFL